MKHLGLIALLVTLLAACGLPPTPPDGLLTPTATLKPSRTPTHTRTATVTATLAASATPPFTSAGTATPIATQTKAATFTATPPPDSTITATVTATATVIPATPTVVVRVPPYPDAPLCPEHDNETFHTLWNEQEGCHYDHEHGQDPFTDEVAAAFPGFDLKALLTTDGIGHTNPSSGMENTHKHGGFKWSVNLTHLEGCTPFESTENGVDASAILFHGMGDYAIELESSVHSTVALLRFCGDAPGYMYVVQHITYGQVVVPYQGPYVAPYERPWVPYDAPRGPYISVDCVDSTLPYDVPQCRRSLAFILDRGLDVNSYWTAKDSGQGPRPENSILFRPFWRVRDAYQVFDWNDQSHPFTYLWVCGGAIYDPQGCEYNNSTTQIHEIAGTIPAQWDNLAGWDTNDAPGYVSAAGFVTRYGALNDACTAPGEDCHPIVLENVPTGSYGSLVVNYPATKLPPNIVPLLPEHDIFFCAGVVCDEKTAAAVPSGWIGQNN